MSDHNASQGVGTPEFRRSLFWGLKRLAFYGELAGAENSDPHVRYEAKSHAKVTLEELTQQVTEGGPQ